MAKIYARKISAGAITLESIPAHWKAKVAELIGGDCT